jgi:hypothetical protein
VLAAPPTLSAIVLRVTLPAPVGMPHRQAVVDMAAIIEAAPVAESVARDDGARPIHEGVGQAPAALVKIACGARIMPGVRDVAAMRQAADMPRLVPLSDEVRDQRLEARREMFRNGNGPGGSGDGHDAAAMPPGRRAGVPAATLHASYPPRLCRPAMTMGGAAGCVVTIDVVVSMVTVATMPVTMAGLRRHRNGQKNCGRYEESHHNSLPLYFCYERRPAGASEVSGRWLRSHAQPERRPC